MMTHDAHLDEIVSAPISQREKLRLIDEQILDVLYDDQLRQVAVAVWEPDDPQIEKRPAYMVGALALNCLLWIPLVIIAFEVFRP